MTSREAPQSNSVEAELNPRKTVYLEDRNLVKEYLGDITPGEIDYDLHTTERGKSPEDYFVNFLPLADIQRAWRFIEINGSEALKEDNINRLAEYSTKPGPIQAAGAIGEALKLEEGYLTPAMKLLFKDPLYALGFKSEAAPETIAATYKPWLDLWRENAVGKKLTEISDIALATKPLAVAMVPWFLFEFVPEQLLTFGTKISSWVGAYGVEKFGPPLINALLSKLPTRARNFLLRDLFSTEKALVSDFEALGIPVNSKTSAVVDAYRKGARLTHPDIGGDPNEFMKLQSAYKNIMKSRTGALDKLFDYFRKSAEFARRRYSGAPSEPRGLLSLLDERGSAMIPFREGDIVKAGEEFGKILKITGETVLVNLSGKVVQKALSELSAVSSKPAEDTAVNLERMQIETESKIKLYQATEQLGAKLENQAGKPLTHEEVLEAAKEAEVLKSGTSREATLKFEAAFLKTRQHLSALAEQPEITAEFIDALRVVANTGTDIARSLESMKIQALPEFAEVKVKVIKDLIKLGKSSEEILAASKGVDFTDEQAVAKFYRQFVKPKLSELLDEYVYMNILSSPLTHIVNTFSNVLQMAGMNPLTKLASGAVDQIAAGLTGKERTNYIEEVPAFYKGALNAVPNAISGALKAMSGKKTLERPDVKHLPTLSKTIDIATLGVGKYFIRALEASDVFFRTMIEAGEVEALSRAHIKKTGSDPSEKDLLKIQKEARERAEYYVFRKKPDQQNETGQGALLSGIDNMTNAVYRLRAVPGVKWFVRFVQTPMNILKQGIEFSPAGVATFKGAKNKSEQAGKAIIGSFVFAGASWLAAAGRTTWGAPTSEKERNEFYAAGLQPYSVRVGDKWISYSKIGPLAYPTAMAAALHYFTKESPKALSDSDMDKVVDAMGGFLSFFSDQSYMRGIADLAEFARGRKTKALAGVPTQLIPLSSLQGWVNNLIDPLQRKAEKGLSINSVIDQIQMKVIGMSQFVPAQADEEGAPVKKKLQAVNAVSPLRVSQVEPGKLADYKEKQEIKREMNRLKKEQERESLGL